MDSTEFNESIAANSNRGIPELLTRDQLTDESLGFLDKGWITLTARVIPLDVERVPQCGYCRIDPTCSVRHGNT